MRVTDNMGLLYTTGDMARNQAITYARQREASSGSRLNNASDDPAAAARLLLFDADIQEIQQCQSNISRSTGELDAADQALESATDLLIQARETALSMANGSMTAEERAQAAVEIQGIRDQLVGLANTQHDGIYIFNGHHTDAAPYDSAGAYVGDDHVRRILAAPGLTVEASVSAGETFTAAGGRDVFGDLDALHAALLSNDVAGIRAAAQNMGDDQKQVTGARAKVGLFTARLQAQGSILEARLVQVQENRSGVADADSIKTLTELAQASKALNVSLQVSAEMLSKLTLVDKL